MNYFTKKLLTKTTISLIAGIATTIGMQAGNVIWNICAGEKARKETEKSPNQ